MLSLANLVLKGGQVSVGLAGPDRHARPFRGPETLFCWEPAACAASIGAGDEVFDMRGHRLGAIREGRAAPGILRILRSR